MPQCFGLTPCTVYGTGAGIDEPSLVPKGGRGLVHAGNRQPSKSAPPEKDPTTPRQDTFRVPRTVVDTYMTRYTVPWIFGNVRRSDLISAPGFAGIGSANE